MGSLRTFLLKASVLSILVIAGNEVAWRAMGMPTTFRDTPALWSKVRRECDVDNSKIAIVGSSRFQAGLDSEVLTRAMPGRRFYQLGMHASSSLPVLEDLANDPNFHGVAIAEFVAPWIWADRATWSDQPVTELLDYTHHEHFGSVIENELQMFGEEHFAFFNPEAKFWLAAGQRWRTGAFQKPMSRMDGQRNQRIAFRAANIKEETHKWMTFDRELAAKLRPDEPANVFKRVAGWIEQIQARGGRVIFFQMVADGPVRDFEEQTWPADRYLQPFAHALPVSVLSYKNYPELASFHCPDGSHLDASDVPKFSEAFARILEREHLLR